MSEPIDLASKRPPVVYTVRLVQWCDGRLEVAVEDVADDPRSREAGRDALHRVLDQWDRDAGVVTYSDWERQTGLLRAALSCVSDKHPDDGARWFLEFARGVLKDTKA